MLKLTTDQEIAFGLLKEFVSDDIDRVFLLKGYAGTGKTSLVLELANFLKEKRIPYKLLASTGRAAKVLSLKTNEKAQTVHSYIYTYEYSEVDSKKNKAKVTFKLKGNVDPPSIIYIVDEASLISDHKSIDQSIEFGTGKLLSDFFSFTENRKVIFVGDPAQLPPINTLFSPAMNAEYISNTFKKPVKEAYLYQVMRYPKDSGIYNNAINLRKLIDNPKQVKYMTIYARQYNDIDVVPLDSELVERYLDKVREKGFSNAIMVAYTNSMCNMLNDRARKLMFPGRASIGPGDLAIVGTNNYLYELENGQHIHIHSVSPKVETMAGLHFRNISFSVVNPDGISDTVLNAKILEEYLYRPKPLITADEELNLLRNFYARTDKEITNDNEKLIRVMGLDPYLNALRIRFGYAITCHKAQGGEWEHIYLILEKILFAQAKDDKEFLLRWTYTALTRAQNHITLLDNICIK